MANVKLIFYGSEGSLTTEHELIAYANQYNRLFISIDNACMPPAYITLDRETAIKFSKEIRKQISYLESEVENG